MHLRGKLCHSRGSKPSSDLCAGFVWFPCGSLLASPVQRHAYMLIGNSTLSVMCECLCVCEAPLTL